LGVSFSRGKEVGNQKPGEIVVEIVVVGRGGVGVGLDIAGSIHLDLLLSFRMISNDIMMKTLS